MEEFTRSRDLITFCCGIERWEEFRNDICVGVQYKSTKQDTWQRSAAAPFEANRIIAIWPIRIIAIDGLDKPWFRAISKHEQIVSRNSKKKEAKQTYPLGRWTTIETRWNEICEARSLLALFVRTIRLSEALSEIQHFQFVLFDTKNLLLWYSVHTVCSMLINTHESTYLI